MPNGTSMFGLASLLLLCACGDGEDRDAARGTEDNERASLPLTGSCAAANGIHPVCGFMNPEDLAVLPGGEKLLVSEMAAFMSDAPGTLSLLDVASDTREPITTVWDNQGVMWGDPNCSPPTPARFSPHGIHLMTRADGRHQVLAVNHGDEQVEFFELSAPDDQWQLDWRGCAKPPDDPFINDVAGLNDGGFLVTQMWNKSTPFDDVVAQLNARQNTGWVWEWQPDSGFNKLPNSDELMPNGITVNPDNSKIFVNIYMGNRHIRIDRASGVVDGQFEVPSPDNVEYGPDGNLWIASHLNDPVEGRCAEGHAGPCLLPFQIIKADPATMQPEVVFEHVGEPMGYVTVALPHQGRLYFGTASGDRLAWVAIE